MSDVKKRKIFIILTIAFLFVFSTVGYTIFNQSLRVSSTSNIKGLWDIRIIDINYKGPNAIKGYAKVDEENTRIHDGGHEADLVSTLYAPLDKVVFTLTVKNFGNINAYLQKLEVRKNQSNDFIRISNTVTEAKKIDAGQSITFDVVVEFLNYHLNEIPSNITSDYTIVPTYVQESNKENMNIDDSVYDWTYRVNSNGDITAYNYDKGNYIELPATIKNDNNEIEQLKTITPDSFKWTPPSSITAFEESQILIFDQENYSFLKSKFISFMKDMLCHGDSTCINSEQSQSIFALYSEIIKPQGVVLSKNAINVGEMLDITSYDTLVKYNSETDKLEMTNDLNEADMILLNVSNLIINKTGSEYTEIKTSILNQIDGLCSLTENESDRLACLEVYNYSIMDEGYSLPSVLPDYIDDVSQLNYDIETGNMSEVETSVNIKVLDLSNATNLTTIKNGSFSGSTTLTTVVLPDNRDLVIEDNAFEGCPNLVVVTTHSKYIGGEVLSKDKYDVSKLLNYDVKRITNEETNLTIGDYAFSNSNIQVLNLPNNTSSIGKHAFNQNQISDLVIPSRIKTIEDYAFANNHISSIELSSGIESIEDYAFASNQITSLVIPNSVTSVGSNSFYNNTLNKLVLSNCDNVCGLMGASSSGLDLTIESGAINTVFAYNSIKNLTLGSGVTSIAINGFKGNNITRLNLGLATSLESIGASAFEDNQISGVITIPASVTTIGNSAFKSNSITGVNLEDAINLQTLTGFENNLIEEIEIPSGVNKIGQYAFYMNQLNEVTIPSGVSIIESDAFASNNIKEVVIPSTVTSISSSTFSGNTLSDLTIANCNVICNLMGASSSNLNLTIESGSIPSSPYNSRTYKYTGEWNYKNIVNLTLGSGITSVGSGAFNGNTLNNLVLGNYYSGIDANTFSSIRNLTIKSGSIPNFSSSALTPFSNKSIKTLTLENGVTYIGNNVFKSNQISSLVIPPSVETIGLYAFNNNIIDYLDLSNATGLVNLSGFTNNQIDSLDLSNCIKLENINQSAFENNRITNLTITPSVKHIYTNAFRYNGMETLDLTGASSLITLGGFRENHLTNITIPNTVKTIGDEAFYGNLLSQLTIPSNITSIGADAFATQLDNNQNVLLNSIVIKMTENYFKSNVTRGVNWNFQNINFSSNLIYEP